MIAVVGAGISGLTVGHRLALAGADVTVFEAAPRPGGVIHTIRRDDRTLDTGPQRMRLTPPLQRLIAELDLGAELRLAPDLPLYIYADQRLRRVPTDLAGVLTTDLVAWPGRLRALLEPLTPGVRSTESAADYFIRKFGRHTYRRAIAPLFGGLFASDPAEMRARHALASMLDTFRVGRSLLPPLVRGLRTRQRPPACTFDDGLQTLTDALARSLGPDLRTASAVRSLHRDGAGYRLTLDDDEIRADRVVLACPPAAAGSALAGVDADAGRRIAGLRVNRLATVHLESDLVLGAMGYQVAPDEGLATHGVTSQHDLFGRPGLYAAFLGGSRRPDVADLPDDRIIELARDEFETVTGAAAEALAVHRTAIPAWDTSWDAIEHLSLPPGVSICANWRDRPGLTGRILDADRVVASLRV